MGRIIRQGIVLAGEGRVGGGNGGGPGPQGREGTKTSFCKSEMVAPGLGVGGNCLLRGQVATGEGFCVPPAGTGGAGDSGHMDNFDP